MTYPTDESAGPAGPQGPKGETGLNGPQGQAGQSGAPGNKIYIGQSTTEVASPMSGDVFINSSSGDYYQFS